MAADDSKSKQTNPSKNNKKRKHYLPHNKPVKKGAYPLRPGVEGFFITCDGGREQQASHEAISVIEAFFEELVEGAEPDVNRSDDANKPLNKVTKFAYSDSSSGEEDDDGDNDGDGNGDHASNNGNEQTKLGQDKNESDLCSKTDESDKKQEQENKDKSDNRRTEEDDSVEPQAKKQCLESSPPGHENLSKKVEEKSIDKLIEAELAEVGDKSKRRFIKLDSGCNGVVFIQMRRRHGDPSPKEIVQHMMTSLASTKKQVSRFILRVLPVEVSCYTSDDEIKRAIKPMVDKYLPLETQTPLKFAVLYDARANTGIDRMKVIDAVAKSVPSLHKVDLSNPNLNIVVQIVKTVCLIGVVEKYKELAKYNLRQLSSSSKP